MYEIEPVILHCNASIHYNRLTAQSYACLLRTVVTLCNIMPRATITELSGWILQSLMMCPGALEKPPENRKYCFKGPPGTHRVFFKNNRMLCGSSVPITMWLKCHQMPSNVAQITTDSVIKMLFSRLCSQVNMHKIAA